MNELDILKIGIVTAYFLIGSICCAAILKRAAQTNALRMGRPSIHAGVLVAFFFLWLPFLIVGLFVELYNARHARKENDPKP